MPVPFERGDQLPDESVAVPAHILADDRLAKALEKSRPRRKQRRDSNSYSLEEGGVPVGHALRM